MRKHWLIYVPELDIMEYIPIEEGTAPIEQIAHFMLNKHDFTGLVIIKEQATNHKLHKRIIIDF